MATLLLELLGSTMIRLTPGTTSLSEEVGSEEGNEWFWIPTSIGLEDEEVCLDATVLKRPGHAVVSVSYSSDFQTASVKDDISKHPDRCCLTYFQENLIVSVSAAMPTLKLLIPPHDLTPAIPSTAYLWSLSCCQVMYLHPSSVAESTASTPLSDTLSLQITHPHLAPAAAFVSAPAASSPVVPLAPVRAPPQPILTGK